MSAGVRQGCGGIRGMKIAGLVARILLGIMFVVFGLNGFLLFFPVPPDLPPLMQQFNGAMFTSHYMWMTSGVQVLCGVLLLLDRYVPLALVVLAAVLVNILTIHITMMPAGLPPAILATILWFLTAWPIRAQFAPLWASRVTPT